MQSHPEEFKRDRDYHDRWVSIVSDVCEWGNDTDKAAINAAMRDIRLNEAHGEALDELLNGPDRRRKQEEDIEYERQLIMQKAAAQRNTTQLAMQQTAAQRYAQQYGQLGAPALGTGAGLLGKSSTLAILDEYANTTRSSITNGNALQLGSEKLDESILKKLKKAAGL
jgi:hypothetical protein